MESLESDIGSEAEGGRSEISDLSYSTYVSRMHFTYSEDKV